MKRLYCYLMSVACSISLTAAEHEIFHAIKSADAGRVKTLLTDGTVVNVRDQEGNTPLITAAMQGSAEAIRMLLESGAEVNAANNSGATALMLGSYSFEKTKLLVSKGAQVNARSKRQNSALMLAARVHGNSKSVKLLLEQGAEVNATNVFGANAIMCAAASEDERNMSILLKYGADVNATLGPGQGPAIWGGGRSPLMWAAHRGDLKAIQLLLANGARVNGVEGFGTALSQAGWAERTEAARALLKAGASVDQRDPMADYTPLHWAASSESGNPELIKLLISHGADVNARGGEPVGAFMGTLYTPLMLAQKRGETEIVRELVKAGGKGDPEGPKQIAEPDKKLPEKLSAELLRSAVAQSLPKLETTAKESVANYQKHSSKQNCMSCHQQYLPVAALGYAKKAGITGDSVVLAELLRLMLNEGQESPAGIAEVTFHPEPAHSYGYSLLGLAANGTPQEPTMESRVHHLALIQGPEGNWYNNLPRPPIQTSDVGATALAVHSLVKYPLAARKAEMQARVQRARRWLWNAEPTNTEELAYKLLGLHWAGEPPARLQKLAQELFAQQRADGGWGQLPKLGTDGYATGQVLFALHEAAGINAKDPRFDSGIRFLLRKQLTDGTWFAARRAFPFQPTMESSFSHGRDGWLSAAATSWAVMALSNAMRDFDSAVALSTAGPAALVSK